MPEELARMERTLMGGWPERWMAELADLSLPEVGGLLSEVPKKYFFVFIFKVTIYVRNFLIKKKHYCPKSKF